MPARSRYYVDRNELLVEIDEKAIEVERQAWRAADLASGLAYRRSIDPEWAIPGKHHVRLASRIFTVFFPAIGPDFVIVRHRASLGAMSLDMVEPIPDWLR